jgi:hypothetical protein
VIGEEQLDQILSYLKCDTGKCFKTTSLWFVGEDLLNEVDKDLAPQWEELLKSAKGW